MPNSDVLRKAQSIGEFAHSFGRCAERLTDLIHFLD